MRSRKGCQKLIGKAVNSSLVQNFLAKSSIFDFDSFTYSDAVREAWDDKKSLTQNLTSMGLVADPNASKIPSLKVSYCCYAC